MEITTDQPHHLTLNTCPWWMGKIITPKLQMTNVVPSSFRNVLLDIKLEWE